MQKLIFTLFILLSPPIAKTEVLTSDDELFSLASARYSAASKVTLDQVSEFLRGVEGKCYERRIVFDHAPTYITYQVGANHQHYKKINDPFLGVSYVEHSTRGAVIKLKSTSYGDLFGSMTDRHHTYLTGLRAIPNLEGRFAWVSFLRMATVNDSVEESRFCYFY